MKEFFKVLKRFVPPYKKYLIWSVFFTFLSAILNVFSFMVLVPILKILFEVEKTEPAAQEPKKAEPKAKKETKAKKEPKATKATKTTKKEPKSTKTKAK